MSKILPTLWLGGVEDAYHAPFLRSAGITHVLNCAEEVDASSHRYSSIPSHIHHLPMEDDETPLAAGQIAEGAAILEEWQREGHTVLVHCRAGISRSATIVLAWLIRYRGASLDDAWKQVVAARNFIRPNDFFMRLLRRRLQPA